MNLPPDLLNALNAQITAERYSAALYRSMAIAFDMANYPGFARWHYLQAAEENSHAEKFIKYLIDRNVTPIITELQRPPLFESTDILALAQSVFGAALAHEQKVTELITSLYALAVDAGDPATSIFLQWFVMEQVEEERALIEIVTRLAAADCPAAVLLLEHELGERK